MTLIREEDLVESIADAFQYISYFHPPDFVTSLSSAWEREESPVSYTHLTLPTIAGV